MSVVIAQMHWGGFDHMGSWGGAWMWLVMAVFWLLVLGVVVWAVVRISSSSQQHRSTSAEQTLAERFARGEIEAGEYRARLEELRR